MKTTWWIEKIQKVCLIENKTSTTISSCGHTFGPLAFSTPWGLVRLSERRIPLWQVLSGLDPQFDCIEHLPAQGWRQTGHGYWYGTVRWFEMRGWTCTPLMAIHLLSRRKMFEMEFEYFKLGVIDSTPGTPPVAGHYSPRQELSENFEGPGQTLHRRGTKYHSARTYFFFVVP